MVDTGGRGMGSWEGQGRRGKGTAFDRAISQGSIPNNYNCKMKVKHRSYLQENNPDHYREHLNSSSNSTPLLNDSNCTQKDYDRILQEKDHTIRELKHMLQVIDRGDKGDREDREDRGDRGDKGDQGGREDKGDRGDQGDRGDRGDKGDKGDKNKEKESIQGMEEGEKGEGEEEGEDRANRNSQLQAFKGKIRHCEKQLKILRIENECLISVIQNNDVNLPSNKEAILQREIKELRTAVDTKEAEIEGQKTHLQSISNQLVEVETKFTQQQESTEALIENNHELEGQKQALEGECSKLMQLIKDRQGSQHEFSHQEFRNTERTAIGKIREQYQESLKVTKEFYTLEGRKMEDRYEQCFLDLSNRLQNYELKVIELQHSRTQLEETPRETPRPSQKQKQTGMDNKQKQTGMEKKQKQTGMDNKQKQPCMEIEYLLQKYYQTEKDLEQEKEANSKLNSQLTIAQKTLKELSIRSLEGSMLFEVSSSFKRDSDPDERRSQLVPVLCQCKKEVEELMCRSLCEKEGHDAKMQTIVSCYENQLQEKVRQLKEQAFQMAQLAQQISTLQKVISKANSSHHEQQQIVEALASELEQKNVRLAGLQVSEEQRFEEAEQASAYAVQLEQELRNLRTVVGQLPPASRHSNHEELALIELQFACKIEENLGLCHQLESARLEVGQLERDKGWAQQQNSCLEKQLTIIEDKLREKTVECSSLRSECKLSQLAHWKAPTCPPPLVPPSPTALMGLVDKLLRGHSGHSEATAETEGDCSATSNCY